VFRLSIRSKILFGFVVVLIAFSVSTLYGVWAVRTLGEQLRLVALGYSVLRLELQDQLTLQANLQKRLAEPDTSPRFLSTVAADRNLRRARLQGARQHVQELRRSQPPGEAAFLGQIENELEELERLYVATGNPQGVRDPRERQLEDEATQLLERMSSRLTNKVVEVVSAGQRYEARAVWMTVLLALAAAATGVVVMLLVQATLRPLRRLCDSAKEVARGNYRAGRDFRDHNLDLDAAYDEVGALAREFNSMAMALEERELRLRRSEQLAAVGKMAAQITHEVRNPLTAIGLNAELLAEELAPQGSEAQHLAEAIVKEVDRLTDITEQYLRFARLPQPRFDRADLNGVLASLLQFASEELRTRGIAVEVDLYPQLTAVVIDDNQVRQALLNLMRNAAEAMAERGEEEGERRLIVRSRQASPTTVAVDVIDTGPGIPAERQRQIFEPFFTTKKGGTGLGLALVQEVVMHHGGQLVITSPLRSTPPYGTRFTVELPAAP
jgi:signal transduction histidine kinase